MGTDLWNSRRANGPDSVIPAQAGIYLSGQDIVQVMPFGIALFDQLDLPRPFPDLKTFFRREGVLDVCECLVVGQLIHAVTPGEARALAALVLVCASQEIVHYTDVQYPILPTGQYVRVVALHFDGSWIPACAGMTHRAVNPESIVLEPSHPWGPVLGLDPAPLCPRARRIPVCIRHA